MQFCELKIFSRHPFSQAYVPILLNPKNQVGWPAVVTSDVKKHVHDFGNSMRQVKK